MALAFLSRLQPLFSSKGKMHTEYGIIPMILGLIIAVFPQHKNCFSHFTSGT